MMRPPSRPREIDPKSGPIEVYAGKPIFYGFANFFWSDAQEPLDPILHETYAARIAEAFAGPTTVTDADQPRVDPEIRRGVKRAGYCQPTGS
jgi:hypothetical protein